MRKTHIVFIVGIGILLVGLSFSSLFAEDFSFIGIKWSDNLDAVREKISQSGLASDTRWMLLHTESTPLSSIMKDPMIDEEKNRELVRIADKLKKDVRIEHQVKYIEFRGKRESVVKNATFFFAYDRDLLLAYSLFLNTQVATVDPQTGQEKFYQELTKKYGSPTKTLKWSKAWSTNDQSLYYTASSDRAIVTFISESNLSGYVTRLEGKPKEAEPIDKQVVPGVIKIN